MPCLVFLQIPKKIHEKVSEENNTQNVWRFGDIERISDEKDGKLTRQGWDRSQQEKAEAEPIDIKLFLVGRKGRFSSKMEE